MDVPLFLFLFLFLQEIDYSTVSPLQWHRENNTRVMTQYSLVTQPRPSIEVILVWRLGNQVTWRYMLQR